MLIHSRAPVRIDFSGGWTDVALFAEDEPGAVINAAINIYSYATVRKLPHKKVETKDYGYKHVKTVEDMSIKIYSADFDVYQEAKDIKALEYDGNVDLIKAAIKKMNLRGGIEIITRSNAPAGSGLGTSAAMGVALTGALNKLSDVSLLPYEFGEIASSIEIHELKISSGKQDHYASAMGGFNFMEFFGENVRVSNLQLPIDTLCELEKNLVLCYTGKSRLSSNVHLNVIDRYLKRHRETLESLKNLKQIALEMKNRLLKGDLSSFGQLLIENWENQKRLHPSVTNSQIDSLFNMVLDQGAIGGKACGAGGGGCLVFFCLPDKEHLVRRKLEESGVTIINFNFDFQGLQTWEGYSRADENQME